MYNSTISAAVSLASLQQRLEVIADNIANSNTNGYKSRSGSFEDVLTRVQQQSEDYRQTGRTMPMGFNIGFGTRLSSLSTDWEQGTLKETGSPSDLALQGNGLFAVSVNGGIGYTRQGAFHFTPDPANPRQLNLVTDEGNAVLGTNGNPVTVPVGVHAAIDESGRVLVKNNENDPPRLAATLMIVEPVSRASLEAVDDSFYMLKDGITPQEAFVQRAAGERPNVGVRSGWLEQSNVDLTKEMTDMLNVQRTFSLVSRALTSSDQMMGLANNMRG